MNSRENRGRKIYSRHRHILFLSFVQRRSEKRHGRWRGNGVTGDFFLMLHILRHVHMVKGVSLSCLQASNTIYKTESPEFLSPYQTSSLASRFKEPTASISPWKSRGHLTLTVSKHGLPIPPLSSACPPSLPFPIPGNVLILERALPFSKCSG